MAFRTAIATCLVLTLCLLTVAVTQPAIGAPSPSSQPRPPVLFDAEEPEAPEEEAEELEPEGEAEEGEGEVEEEEETAQVARKARRRHHRRHHVHGSCHRAAKPRPRACSHHR